MATGGEGLAAAATAAALESLSLSDQLETTTTTTESTATAGGAGGDTTNLSDVQPLKIPASQRSEDYGKLVAYGLHEKVAAKLDDVYNTGKLCHSDLDERALDALKEFPVDGALLVLKQFLDSNLEHVSNKSAYLCGVMKTYRQKTRQAHHQQQHPNNSHLLNTPLAQSNTLKGPDEEKIKLILARTGYSLDVTTGQRKYGGPPPNWEAGINPPPGNGCEVFCGKIPKDLYEDELIPLFENCGRIWDLRLMMDPMTGLNRGYAFVTFTSRDGANEAVKQLNEYEIRKGKKIGVTISYNNHRLFVGNIPKNRDRDEIFEEFTKHAPGLTEVIIYSSPDDRKKNRGFCFLEYESHKAASLAKRRLSTARVKIFGCDIIVDWADPQEEPDDEIMSKVKVLYVRNLNGDVTEDKLKEVFEVHGSIDRVKKIKDYAFIHFDDRESAEKALREMNGKDICGTGNGVGIEISLAKPPSDKKRKEEVLRARERRMMAIIAQQRPPLLPPLHMGRGGRGGGLGRGGPLGRTADFAATWPWLAAAAWDGMGAAAGVGVGSSSNHHHHHNHHTGGGWGRTNHNGTGGGNNGNGGGGSGNGGSHSHGALGPRWADPSADLWNGTAAASASLAAAAAWGSSAAAAAAWNSSRSPAAAAAAASAAAAAGLPWGWNTTAGHHQQHGGRNNHQHQHSNHHHHGHGGSSSYHNNSTTTTNHHHNGHAGNNGNGNNGGGSGSGGWRGKKFSSQKNSHGGNNSNSTTTTTSSASEQPNAAETTTTNNAN